MRILSILLLVLPLAFPEACAEGVRHGLTLAGSTAIPALFPFFVAGGLLSEAGTAAPAWAAKLLRCLYGLPPESLPAVFLGLTGGYPVGAAVSASLCREGRLSPADARRCALFCSCASPGFCAALAGVTLFGSVRTGLLLYGIQAASALLSGLFVSRETDFSETLPISSELSSAKSFSSAFCAAVRNAAEISLSVAAFLAAFSVVLELIKPLFSRVPLLRLLAPLLELTSGLDAVSALFLPETVLFPLVSFALAFGGAAVLMQIQTAFSAESGAALPGLFRAKLRHGLLAAALACAVCRLFPACMPVFGTARPVSCPSAASALTLAAVTVLYVFCTGKTGRDTL